MISLAAKSGTAYLPCMGKRTTKSKVGGARPGAGRKPSPPRTLKRHRVVLLLDDAELRSLKKAAGGQRLNEFAREAVLALTRRKGKQ